MRELLLIEWIFYFSSHAIVIGLGLLVQSTIIITPCLFAVYALRNKGSAVQSLVLRATLVAVLLCPLISLYFHTSGVKIFKVSIPSVSYELPEKAASSLGTGGAGTPASDKNVPEISAVVDGSYPRTRFTDEAIFFDKAGESIPLFWNPQHIIPTAENDLSVMYLTTAAVESYSSGKQHSPVAASPERAKAHSVRTASEIRSQAMLSVLRIAVYLIFTFAWIAFSVFLLCRIILHSVSVKYIREKASLVKPGHSALCRDLSDEFGLKYPGILQSAFIKSPFLSGIFKPIILMPKCDEGFSLPIKEILLHELSHLQRYDCFWNLLRQIGTLIVPFQPLMWILSHWIEETSDYACDDFVMEYTGNNRSYARVLLTIAQSFQQSGCEATAGVGFLSFKSPLRRRIGRILNSSHILSLRTNARLVLCISFLCFSASIASGFVGFESENVLNRRTGTFNIVSAMILNNIIDPFPGTALTPISLVQIGVDPFEKVNADKTESHANESPDSIEMDDSGPSEMQSAASGESLFAAIGAVEPGERGFRRNELSHVLPGAGTEAMNDEQILLAAFNEDIHSADRPESDRQSENTPVALSAGPSVTMPENGSETQVQAQMSSAQTFGSSSGLSFAGGGGGGMQISGFNGDMIKMPVAKAVNVTVDVDYENQMYDLQNEEDKRQYSIYHGLDKLKNEPAWSPDGKWIAFTDRSRIWIVSPNGGDPKLVYESFHDGFSIGNFESLCFSHDSREIMFKKDMYDTNRGSEIVIRENGLFRAATFSNPIPNIESVNITTGEHRVIIEEGYNFGRSFDGRYICFLSWASRLDSGGAKSGGHGLPALYDTETKETRFLADDGRRYGKPAFGPDEGFVIIPVREESGPIELHKLFADGNQSEQLTFFDENDGICRFQNFPEVSPDGNWILCTDFTMTENSPGSSLYLYSTVTGERFEFFEKAESRNSFGKWSPDGTKICYLVQEKDSNYIYICDFFPENYALKKPALNVEEAPVIFKLNQNFPNPFNSSTTIEFSVPEAGHVSLTIYNIMGQKVTELISSNTEPGIHSVVWDGRDENGMSVSTGVYVSCLQMGNKSEIRKMTLFK